MSERPLTKNVEKVARAILPDTPSRERFLESLSSGDHGVTAVAWLHEAPVPGVVVADTQRPAWLPPWVEVAAKGTRPGTLPQHDAGALYVLDLSSTFALAPLSEIAESVRSVVDVCAAPGGKGILAYRYTNPEVILANEVIRKRTAQLIANYKRCRIDPAIVTSCDPKLLARLIPAQADLVIVDAPCSGQSLALKDMAAPGAFHPATIAMNERRQRRILAESAKTVAPGGYLLYSTCTFSPEENERNVEWFCKTFPEFSALNLAVLDSYRSPLSELPTYRLFPQHGYGAGAFCCLLRKQGMREESGTLTLHELPSVIWPIWASQTMEPYLRPRPNPDNPRRDKGRQDKRFGGRSRRK